MEKIEINGLSCYILKDNQGIIVFGDNKASNNICVYNDKKSLRTIEINDISDPEVVFDKFNHNSNFNMVGSTSFGQCLFSPIYFVSKELPDILKMKEVKLENGNYDVSITYVKQNEESKIEWLKYDKKQKVKKNKICSKE